MKVLTSDRELDELSRDAGIIRLRPKAAYVAESENEVSEVLRIADSRGLSLTARGGGTSIPSQSVGTGIVLLQSGNGIFMEAGSVRCSPAVVKARLNKELGDHGLWMPVDPSSYASCTVGGMVSNNSAGIRTPKYGTTVDHVLGLRMVFPGEGPAPLAPTPIESALLGEPKLRKVAELLLENQKSILEERPRVSKNSSGYRLERGIRDGLLDLPRLLVGSEGTLGVVTEVTLASSTKPRWRTLFVVDATLEGLADVVASFSGLGPSAIELLDKSVFHRMGRGEMIAKYTRSEGSYFLFCEFDGDDGQDEKMQEVAESKAMGYDPMVLTEPSEVSAAWEVRNETLKLGLEVRSEGKILVPGVEDLVVPKEKLADLVKLLQGEFDRRGLVYISYGHAGDANLHARPLLDPEAPAGRRVLEELMETCFEAVWKLGGSMTGEHGDGMLRAPFVERQYPRTYWIMKEIKNIFDPKGLLNPGVKIV
ncbi:MAG: FAD-binding oxidoreductase [Thaumarchaeota archaeon]|nr:FAD-binding oxidoreductase [Nitrososphaerota archaeon]